MKQCRLMRQYSITLPEDDDNISHTRCPDYALAWPVNQHVRHWSPNHDFLMGDTDTPSPTFSHTIRSALKRHYQHSPANRIVVCDINALVSSPHDWTQNGSRIWDAIKSLHPIVLIPYDNRANYNTLLGEHATHICQSPAEYNDWCICSAAFIDESYATADNVDQLLASIAVIGNVHFVKNK